MLKNNAIDNLTGNKVAVTLAVASVAAIGLYSFYTKQSSNQDERDLKAKAAQNLALVQSLRNQKQFTGTFQKRDNATGKLLPGTYTINMYTQAERIYDAIDSTWMWNNNVMAVKLIKDITPDYMAMLGQCYAQLFGLNLRNSLVKNLTQPMLDSISKYINAF